MRTADRVPKCLLLGVDRTYRGHHEPDAFGTTRTSQRVCFCAAVWGIADVESGSPRRYFALVAYPGQTFCNAHYAISAVSYRSPTNLTTIVR
jgi:hypothetical protein